MKKQAILTQSKLGLAIALALAGPFAYAQQQEQTSDTAIEEVVTTGARLQGSAAAVVEERKAQAFVADILGAEQISRTGDSDAAAALRRVTGLTLVDGKFIYVRGLGERYSSTQLNGASVPSPDPTRNVIPLDMFPASIIESMAVQKSYSPDMPANFGGGNVDIRTISIPTEETFEVSVGTGWNTNFSDDGLTYAGGDDDWLGKDDGTRALPQAMRDALARYQESINTASIASYEGISFAEAAAINRQLGASLNTQNEVYSKSLSPDIKGSLTYGNSYDTGHDVTFGFLAGVDYDNSWTNNEETEEVLGIANGETVVNQRSETRVTTQDVELSGILNFGIKVGDYHRLEASTIFLRNTADRVEQGGIETPNSIDETDLSYYDTDIRYEQRELLTNQIRGSHYFPQLAGFALDWQYADSRASRDAPGEIFYRQINNRDLGEGIGELAFQQTRTATTLQYQTLKDDAQDWRVDGELPWYVGDMEVLLKGGGQVSKKARSSFSRRYALSAEQVANEELVGVDYNDLFSDANILDDDFGLALYGAPTSTDPNYLAAQQIEAGYGMADVQLNSDWRISGGVRWEQYTQVAAQLDIRSMTMIGDIKEAGRVEDDLYGSLAVTYALNDEMQLRFGYGSTVVRPDLRELTEVIFVDPLTDFKVRGNSDLVTTDIDNFDVRWEWYLPSGENYSVAMFYKDLANPIEAVEAKGTDSDRVITFLNGQSGEVYGVEFEFLKDLTALTDGLFVSGNLTLSDSEISIANTGNVELTNNTRRMTGHSKYVTNLQLGYDSLNGEHSASLIYNVAGERIAFAGVKQGELGIDDAFEQPFHSLDLVYTFYPDFNSKVKFKVQNMLGEDVEIEQNGRLIQSRSVGTSFTLEYSYAF
ncbi:TonB-dependent receptor domain-containing protein [Pseudidiomarina insulisalsae]|uniref:TonB-dependent receptor n=1 Tax=Pseudidiomarina insulisalsae TaxID=575789 RepID=A0A432YCP3_9GAMM|nr:TonB-dependent receptor [Pseudidiomarina insulisalsae]RUO58770.1 TonB-dependent receptor [Pseudidiomarina insulisalsae]